MVQQDGRVLFSRSALLNAGNMVTVLRNIKHLLIRSIVPSVPSALTRRVNYITPNEYCDRKCTGLVKV
jgi:hypothetical protein